MSVKFILVALSAIKILSNVRKTFDEAELRRLGESLKVKQLQPIVIKPDGTLIAGERRVRAALLVGMTHLLAMVSEEELSESQLMVLQACENLNRADLSAFEKFNTCQDLLRLNPSWTATNLAKQLHLDASYITRILSPANLVPAAFEAFKSGKLPLATAYELSKSGSPADQERLLAAVLNGASREQVIRQRKEPKGEGAKASSLKLVLGDGWQVTIKARDAFTLAQAAEALQKASKEAAKGNNDGLTVKTFAKVLADRNKGGKS